MPLVVFKNIHANNSKKTTHKKRLLLWRHRGLHILPNLFTLGNAFFGFYSIVFVAYGEIIAATHAILLGALMDILDGRIARITGNTSELGLQLDSLCDAISFCLAPAFLIYGWQLKKLGPIGFLACAFFLLAGLLRLARFNLTHANQTEYFLGVPTTMAAGTIAVLVLNCHHFIFSPILHWALLGLVLGLATLMISGIKFPTFKHIKKSWAILFFFILIGFGLIFSLIKLGLIIICCYFLLALEETIRLKFFVENNCFNEKPPL